jgi:PAS domain S-box-containing protein
MVRPRLAVLVPLLAVLAALPAAAQERSLLILHSYHQGPSWVETVTDGIRSVLDTSDMDIQYRYEYMNVLDADPAGYAEVYSRRLGRMRFDLVLCVGNAALEFVVKNREALFTGLPVVFCSVNRFSPPLLAGQKGITGVTGTGRRDAAGTLRIIRGLHPRMRRLLVLANRQVAAESAAYDELAEVVRGEVGRGVDVRFWEDPPLEELVLFESDPDAKDTVIFDIAFPTDSMGQPLPLGSSTRQASRALAIPMYSIWESLLGNGIVGGMISGGFQQGEAAARMAVRILGGERAELIPVMTEGQSRPMFDAVQLARFGIREESLPVASVLVNKPVPFIDRYRTLLVVSVAILAVLVLLLTVSFLYNARQRRLQESISRSEQRLSLALDATGSGIWEYDPATGRTWYDPRWYRMLGYEPRCMPDEYGTWADLLHPDDRPAAEAEVRRNVREGSDFTLEFRMRAQDGSYRWILSSSKVVGRKPDGSTARMVGTHVDITARKEAEEAVRESAQRYRFLYERSPAISLVIGTDGTIRDVNNAFLSTLGYAREEVIGIPALELVVPEHRDALAAQIGKDLRGEPTPQVEVDAFAKDGTRRTVLFSESSALLHDGQEAAGVLATGIDITERRRAMERARLQEQQLIQADKMASLGILVSGVAHEINNPNNFILLNGRICSRVWEDIQPILVEYRERNGDFVVAGMPFSESQPRIGRLIAGIHEGAQRIKKIVQNLRDFARRDSGEMSGGVDLNRVVDSAVTLVQNLIDKSTTRFTMDLSTDLPLITGNFQQLEQVVINLLTNACQALEAREKAIRVRTRRGPAGRAVVEVQDEGVGISRRDLAHVLDPFFTTKQNRGGTGLGLSISYNIVKNHGGDLAIASEQGTGTTVTVRLPAAGEGA